MTTSTTSSYSRGNLRGSSSSSSAAAATTEKYEDEDGDEFNDIQPKASQTIENIEIHTIVKLANKRIKHI